MEKRTALYDEHVRLGGKMVPFAGYSLPVQYQGGVIAEHMAVRERAGIFDVSHMGEFFLCGSGALITLNHLLTNDFSNMLDGQVRYSPMCNDDGGIIDDLIVYRFHAEKYMLVVNASNREKDFAWMSDHLLPDCELADHSDILCEIALQGPASRAILAQLMDEAQIPAKYYFFSHDVQVAGIPCIVSRTGYTGEMGYELYMLPEHAVAVWHQLLCVGAEMGLCPCGLGARDTLRLEAGMPLYGHEMADDISPLEAGLSWAVKMQKPGFIGKEAIEAKGKPRARAILQVTGKGIAREHQPVFLHGEQIGTTTSGTHLPYLGGAYALALLDSQYATTDQPLEIEVRGRRIAAKIIPQLYKRT